MMFNRYFYDVGLAMQFEDGVVTAKFRPFDLKSSLSQVHDMFSASLGHVNVTLEIIIT